ncbi:uncharacterized protein V6R79_025385 [Siganus canaliculatus]
MNDEMTSPRWRTGGAAVQLYQLCKHVSCLQKGKLKSRERFSHHIGAEEVVRYTKMTRIDRNEDRNKKSRKKFFVRVAGKTIGAHHELVAWIQQSGHVEVTDPDSCDHMLVFCPVASRVGTDVGETVENLPADKDTVLVVMHHTHNRSAVIAESSRLVNKPNIFTVDTLFYEGKLLRCDLNDEAWQKIQRHLRISPSQDSLSTNWPGTKFFVHVAGKTNGAHNELVDRIKRGGLVEVMDPDSCDNMLVFCPVASRVGTDVGETVENLPADKHTLLLVMHHTHNRSAVIAESSRLVNKPNIFTVDTLFYEGELLTCDANDKAWQQIQRHLRISPSQGPLSHGSTDWSPSSGSRKKFFVHVSGKTNGAHHELVAWIQQSGHVEVMDPDSCDYMLVFCPVASRVGTDVGETVENLPADKHTVLVVMHHTYNRSAVIAESSRLVNKPNIFTVDILFYEGKLLTSNVNDEAWQQIQRHLDISPSQDPHSRRSTNNSTGTWDSWKRKHLPFLPDLPSISIPSFKRPTHKTHS